MKTVALSAPLPYPRSAANMQALRSFDQDLIKALQLYLTEVALRLNNVLPKDGSEPMISPLPIGSGGTGATTAGGALTNLGISAFVQTLLGITDADNFREALEVDFEVGSNSNGQFLRFDNGWQICTISGVSVSNVTTAAGNLFSTATSNSATWTYPLAFDVAPAVSMGGGSGSSLRWLVPHTITDVDCIVRAFSATSVATASTFTLLAVGRWL